MAIPRIWFAVATAAVPTAVVLGLGMFGATPATASTPSTTAGSPQVEQLCARLLLADARIDRLVERINGAADAPGSLAFLNERVAQAEGRKDGARAESLRSRADLRAEQLDYLIKAKALAASTRAEYCEGAK